MRKGILKAYIHDALHPMQIYRRIIYYVTLAQQFDEVFVSGTYDWLYERIKPNTTVVDIGAYIGDTAIYFAMHPNVRKVLAFEANPKTYAIARKLLDKNPSKYKIVLKNQAVAASSGKMKVNVRYAANLEFSVKEGENVGKDTCEIETVGFNGILKGNRNMVIKSDCEGTEYSIFSKDADLSHVYAMIIECHDGVQNLKEILTRKGFQVKIREPGRGETIGYLYAQKAD